MRCDTTGTGWRLKAKASISPCDSHFSPEIFLLFDILIFWKCFCCSLSLSLLSKWAMHCIANVICSSLFFFQLCLWSRVCKVGSLHWNPLTLAWSSIVVLQNYIIPVFQWFGIAVIPISTWLPCQYQNWLTLMNFRTLKMRWGQLRNSIHFLIEISAIHLFTDANSETLNTVGFKLENNVMGWVC